MYTEFNNPIVVKAKEERAAFLKSLFSRLFARKHVRFAQA